MLKGAGRAASMFEKEPDLQADIVIWFRTNLLVSADAVLPSLNKEYKMATKGHKKTQEAGSTL